MLRIKFSAGRQFCASKSASSPSAKTLAVSLSHRTEIEKLQMNKQIKSCVILLENLLFSNKKYSRKDFMEKLLPTVQHFYTIISNEKEEVSIVYSSHLQEDNFGNLLKNCIEKDRVLTYTSKGIHKDDLLFEMNAQPMKKVSSQGQQKSFLIALKLAQMNRIKELTGKTPILLLDDIFDKLDDTRVLQLIELVNQEHFGQIFITDTHRERTERVVKQINEESSVFEL